MAEERKPDNAEDTAEGYLAYDLPADILQDEGLDEDGKQKLLESWKMDLDSRLYAESEGMSKSEPMDAAKEARLADQERLVGQALETLNNEKS